MNERVSFLVPVYQQTSDGVVTYRTVGLNVGVEPDIRDPNAGLEIIRRARNLSSAREQMASALRVWVAKTDPAQIASMARVRNTELVRTRLEVKAGRQNMTGVYPIILQTRPTGETTRVRVAFHPARPQEVVPVGADDDLKDVLRVFFARTWSELDEAQRDALKGGRGRDALLAFAFDARPRSLLDRLSKRQGLWSDLEASPDKAGVSGQKRRSGRQTLLELSEDLTHRAASDALNSFHGRGALRAEVGQQLTGRRKNSFVLLGPRGAGKRSLIHQAVADVLEADGYRVHRNIDKVTHVHAIAASRLIAGMSHLGEWEERLVEVVEAARGERAILYFEDLHTLGRVGRSRESERCFADVLRGPLGRRDIIAIGACTESQWQRLEDDAPAFASLFSTLHIEPTSSKETLGILLHRAREIEADTPGVVIDPACFRTILEVGAPALVGAALPGAAVELLKRATPYIARFGAQYAVHRALEARTGMLTSETPNSRVADVVSELERRVIGQPAAVRAVAELVVKIDNGICDPQRPFGAYLFTGPTGTGKTELAKALAERLYSRDPSRLVRFDMGEFGGWDAVSRLLGDAHNPRGLLTERVRHQPFCVVLLDEIEKAHPAVLHLLLQLLDDGRLTDAQGDRADFRRSVIVMTSNLGAASRAAVGFGDGAANAHLDVAHAVREFFPPELFNRIERVVPFTPLDEAAVIEIARKELAQLLVRRGLRDRDVFVIAHRSAARRIAHEAFDSRAGARSIKRYLELHVTSKIAEHLAARARPMLEVLRLYADDDGYAIVSEPLVEAEPVGESTLGRLTSASTDELQAAAADALTLVRELEREDLPRITESVATLLEGFTADAASDGVAIHHLDALRGDVIRTRESLEAIVHFDEWREEEARELDVSRQIRPDTSSRRHPDHSRPDPRLRGPRSHALARAPRRTRDALMDELSEVAFLRRVMRDDSEVPQHVVTLELLAIGPRVRDMPFVAALARTYAGLRGDVVEAAARIDGDERVHTGSLDALLELDPTHLAMTLVGSGVRAFFESELGCHAQLGVSGASSIVRVRAVEGSPREHLERHGDTRRAYERALEEGRRPGEDPGALDPLVRKYSLGAHVGTEPIPYAIEDFRLQEVRAGHAVDPFAEIRGLVRLSLGVVTEPSRSRSDV